jgi:DeoR/GlpR family transcriptional regulator of sugar metabolism
MVAPMPSDAPTPADGPGPGTRSKAARLHYIADAVQTQGFVTVDDLADALGVSRMTVHRDLDALQSDNVLRKSFSNAVVR